jgi:two-component sensor histidine kinase
LNDPNIFEERIHPEDKAEKDRFTMEAIKQAQEFIHEYRFQVKDHGWVWLRNRSKPSRQEDGGLIWNGVIIDITEQKTFEHELMIAKNRLELAAQAAGLGVWDADLTTGNILWDAGMARIYGIDPSENYLSKDRWTQFIHPDDLPLVEKQDHEMIHGDSNLYRGSFRIIREDNKEIRHVETLGIIDRDKNGRVLRMAGVNTDRTTERVYEQQLIQNVKEKEALIKEIHHRVKNNLQLISSILYLRLAGLADQEIKTFLQDTRQKIRSIALIHERLLQTGSVNLVDISDYLGKLISDMQTTIPPEGQRVNITYSIEPWQLGLDVAINCGLIVNELVTNSMKYAFNGRSNGQIEITFKKHLTGYEMIVADDGVGIPANVFPGKSESFGMQLLEIFTNQLRATCEIQRDKGTAFIIRFAPPGEN